jgi:biotin carboxylase
MERENKFYFIEINPRYAAGGLMLTVNAGTNIPLLALKVMLGVPIENSELRHIPDIGITRYWEEIILNKINGVDE